MSETKITKMEFLDNLFSNKTITESSKQLYKKNLIKLNDGKPVKNLSFLKDEEGILEKIKNYKPNTQRNYIIAIVSALSADKSKHKKLYQSYGELLEELNKTLKDATDKKPQEAENWIEYEEIQKLYQSLYDKAMESKKYEDLFPAILLGLYIAHPPRRNQDYQQMIIVRDYSKIKDEDSKNYNYLDLKGKRFIFNQYKTRGKYEQQVLPVNDEFMKLINEWIKKHPCKKELKDGLWLLCDEDGKSLKHNNSITTELNKLFKKHLGKKIGSSMLRKIYLTSKYADKAEELKQDTEAMGTSVGTAQTNYIKK